MESRKPVTIPQFKKMKKDGTPIAFLTAYDYPSAQLAEEAGVDGILIGDSLGNVVLGYDSTIPVTLDDMIHHTKAVTRGAKIPFVITDMPFLTYHGSIDETMRNVGRVMREGLCKGVKMEGGAEIAATVEACVRAGVPVMGHIGLTPQAVHQIGGYRIQGKDSAGAQKLLEDALALEKAGAFAIVLELVTEEVARMITSRLSIPTIGIGAGAGCDGQILVYHDILNYGSDIRPKKFVKTYTDIGSTIRQGIRQYVDEVKAGQFPRDEHAFKGNQEAISYLYGTKE
ncbi:MAG: 3-methyl-2-oxobutanoate hydroxymethyltransferase [Paenibacillaceae bacterium]|nr:3-methyl-2-oxobutanoate hydroxymethyltransferase [Paenibacillaceae bacterium]